MFDFQSHFIFPTHAVPKAGKLPQGAEGLSLATSDGETIRGVHIPPHDAPERRTVILGFGGNAWNGQDVAEYLHELYPEADVVTFHYRGYSPSTGSPSAEALIADAPLVYDFAKKRMKASRIIAVGFSIGTGVALQLAAARPVCGLILVTPFDSLRAVAQAMYPWLPIGPVFAHEIDAGAAVQRVQVPVAVIEAQRDEIVPAERTNALRRQIPNLVFDRTIARAGHNDIYVRSDFHEAMREALEAVSGR
jgi:pimeloyl-ACP methyl ester carboxylesterase